MLPSVLKRGCDLQQSSSTASSQTTAQYLFIETRECTVNMKHFAKSQEITAISRPFGEHNHPRWNVSGLRIIRLETVIVHTAFSGFFWRAGRRGGGGGKVERAKSDFSLQSPHKSLWQMTGNCYFAAIARNSSCVSWRRRRRRAEQVYTSP